jgi:hypothetical protein
MEDIEDLNLNHKKFSPKTHQFQISWWFFLGLCDLLIIIKSPPAYRQAGSPLFALRARGPMGRWPKRGEKEETLPKRGKERENISKETVS